MKEPFLDSLRPAQREPMWRRALSERGQQVHVCYSPAEILGFSSAGACRGAPSDAELYAISVYPDQWGRGCGRVLFLESCAAMRAREFECLLLWVATRNEQARASYERAGVAPDGPPRRHS